MRTSPRPPLWTDAFWAAVNPAVAIVGFQRTEPGWLSQPTDFIQPDFDIWYVASGRGAVRVDGAWHDFGAGDLLCLKPGSRYQRERTDDANPFQLYYTHILPFGSPDHAFNDGLAAAWPLRLSVPHRPEFLRLFVQLFEAHVTRPTPGALTVKGLALQVLDAVFDELQHSPRRRQPGTHEGLRKAKALIESAFADPLTVSDIAAASGLCASHLSALFSRQLGVSPFEYLIRVRIREARLLLARGLRVKEVAQRTGFHSQQYFCRQFRQRTGQAPTDFARQSRWRNQPPPSGRPSLPA